MRTQVKKNPDSDIPIFEVQFVYDFSEIANVVVIFHQNIISHVIINGLSVPVE